MFLLLHFVLAAFFLGTSLQGCGSGPSPSPPPSPGPGPSPSPSGFSLHPIEVHGQHLYDSVTHKPFLAVGVAFPNTLPNDPKEWIEVLRRIGRESHKSVNMIRLYDLPLCLWNDLEGSCFVDFMKEADELGIYVIFPGTGTVSGYIPREGWTDAQDCYEKGKALNMGRGVAQRANYPNTLAIVIGNEFFTDGTTFRVANVFKAYARDLKAYMKMCNDDPDSPSKGAMRQIPVLYAERDLGDDRDPEVMSFMMCGSAETSVDIIGLNIERWCDPAATDVYGVLHKKVESLALPGSFMFTEMGCPQNLVSHAPPGQECRTLPVVGRCCPRNWNQVPDFFKQYHMFDGFSAYAFWNNGAMNFNMAGSKWSNATLLDDGANFFKQTKQVYKQLDRPVTEGQRAKCAEKLENIDLLPLDGIKSYDDNLFPAKQCPSHKYMRASDILTYV